eukprot:Skav225478  [mRNA]  locus=scaffold3604:237226:237522:+ [translate_table: standard]
MCIVIGWWCGGRDGDGATKEAPQEDSAKGRKPKPKEAAQQHQKPSRAQKSAKDPGASGSPKDRARCFQNEVRCGHEWWCTRKHQSFKSALHANRNSRL